MTREETKQALDWFRNRSKTVTMSGARRMYLLAIEALEQTEIVRCKDCKHRDPEDKKCDSGHAIQWQLPRQDDWYCADAERRTDEE